MQLGKKIRDLRLRRGMTVQQLAEASGLSKGFISQVENSRTSPSLATLQDLARSLDRAIAAFGAPGWSARVSAGMAGDFSWDRSVELYLDVFREAVSR